MYPACRACTDDSSQEYAIWAAVEEQHSENRQVEGDFRQQSMNGSSLPTLYPCHTAAALAMAASAVACVLPLHVGSAPLPFVVC